MVNVLLRSLEDGGWRLGDHPVRNGHVIVRGGKQYVLELFFGRWRLARYLMRSVAGSTAVTDGIPAASASINDPYGVAVDSLGNLYIADSGNERIRKVDLSGIITTLAGTGERGRSGDGGPATEAQLVHPTDVATDAAGNVYIPDGSRVRKVDPSGIITTLAGTVERGFSGDGGPANQAQLSRATDVALDSAGNIFIADSHNHRVRKVDPAGIIATVAGTGERGFSGDGGPATEAQLSYPGALAVDSSGNVLVEDGFRVRRIDPSGIITTLAGPGEEGVLGDGGPATEERLSFVSGLAADASGNVYVASRLHRRIRKIDASGTITTLVGTGEAGISGDGGPAAEAHLWLPTSVAVDGSGNVYVTEYNRVRKINPSGIITPLAGSGGRGYSEDGHPATAISLTFPNAMAVDGTGCVYVVDNKRVRKIDPSGIITTVFPISNFISAMAAD